MSDVLDILNLANKTENSPLTCCLNLIRCMKHLRTSVFRSALPWLVNEQLMITIFLFFFSQGNWKLLDREAGYSVHIGWSMGVVPVSFKAVRVSLKINMENCWCIKLQEIRWERYHVLNLIFKGLRTNTIKYLLYAILFCLNETVFGS